MSPREVQLPSGPGLGIALDEDRVNHFRRDRNRISVGAPVSSVAAPV